jgi:two-component system NtrC family response regulator
LLAQEFLRRSATETGKSGLTFDKEALRAISSHPWPGNVRELENRVKRGVIMADGKRISAADLELAGDEASTSGTTLREAREAVERKLIQNALRKHSGKITAVANELGISRPTLYELMEKLQIKPEGGKLKAEGP